MPSSRFPSGTAGSVAGSQSTSIRVGTAGWSIPRTSAESFPGSGSHLERYAHVFPCAEINSTFYRSSRLSTYARWAVSVPETFRFSVKAPRAITHDAALACTPAQLRVFLDEVQTLGSKLGAILFQLPPKGVLDAAVASTFFAVLRDQYAGPVALEPRHQSWFTPEVNSLLQKFRISRVATDPIRTPGAAHPGGDTGLVYYRLHGSPRPYYSAYTSEYLIDLAATLRHAAESAATWCIFDNTASGAAAANALTLAGYLALG